MAVVSRENKDLPDRRETPALKVLQVHPGLPGLLVRPALRDPQGLQDLQDLLDRKVIRVPQLTPNRNVLTLKAASVGCLFGFGCQTVARVNRPFPIQRR